MKIFDCFLLLSWIMAPFSVSGYFGTILYPDSKGAPTLYANYTGDILLAGFFPVHMRKSYSWTQECPCGNINKPDGLVALEAMMFALDQINSRQNFLSFKLGAFAVDTCTQVDYTLSNSLDLLHVRIAMKRGTSENLSGHLVDQQMVKAVGLIGASDSDVSMALNNLFKLFHFPQVSYFSTSPELSSKERFDYFLRTIPSDKNSVYAISELLRRFDWLYVNVIYDDSNFGSEAFSSFGEFIKIDKKLNHQKRVCIAEEIRLKVVEKDAQNYRTKVEKILEVKRATVNVVFLSEATAKNFFKEVKDYNDSRIRTSFIWLGMDSYSDREYVPNEIVTDWITVMPKALYVREFEEYLQRLRPSKNPRNPWLKEMFEQNCNCRYSNNTDTSVGCSHMEQRFLSDMPPDCATMEDICANMTFKDSIFQKAHFVMDSVYAYAYALKNIQDKKCAVNGYPCNLIASDVKGNLLFDELKSVNFTDDTGTPFHFVDQRDGPISYSIIYVSQNLEAKGSYSVDSEGTTPQMIFEPQFTTMIERRNISSTCDEVCIVGQAKIKVGQCCWTCRNCAENAIILTQGIEVSKCQECPAIKTPDATRKKCIDKKKDYIHFKEPVAMIVLALSGLGILVLIPFCSVYFIFRNTPVIMATGRETSCVILFGIFLSYLTPIAIVMKPNIISCYILNIAPPLCITIGYSGILSRTTRIVRIFKLSAHSVRKTKFTSPRSQLYLMSAMVIAEACFLAIFTGLDPPEVQERPKSNIEIVCFRKQVISGYLSGLIFPLALLGASTVFAFKIRKMPDGFNEARHLAFVNYINIVLIVIFFPFLFIEAVADSIYCGVPVAFFLILSANAELLSLFWPRVYLVLFKPEKNTRESVMSRSRTTSQASCMDLKHHISGSLSTVGEGRSQETLEVSSIDRMDAEMSDRLEIQSESPRKHSKSVSFTGQTKINQGEMSSSARENTSF